MATSTSTWLNGASGDWNTAANWSGSIVPNNALTDIRIAATPIASTYTVTVAAGTTISVGGVTLNHTGATLSISGVLQLNGGALAVNQGTVTLASNSSVLNGVGTLTGLVAGRGTISGAGTLTNQGTIIANRNLNTLLISAPLLNNGSVVSSASGGGSVLNIQAASSGNFNTGTLTGGTYAAIGSTSSQNQVRIRIGGASVITTNAATLTFDGTSNDIQGHDGAGFVSVANQLQTIAAAGTLRLLNHKNFVAANAITNLGSIVLQNGTLSGVTLTNSAVVTGFGVLKAPVVNTGTITVTSNAIDIDETLSGTGALSVAAGARLILEGAAPTSLHNDGTVFNTEGNLTLGAITGTGTLVVENGATLTLNQATAQTVMFGGPNATLRLNDPLGFTGTIVGLGRGDVDSVADSLILAGVTATQASIVNTNTLAIINAGTTIDTMVLSGDYSAATFSASKSGADTIIRAVSDTPARKGLAATITVTDLASIDAGTEAQIVANMQRAVDDWGAYITGHAPLRIGLTLSNTTSGSTLAEALFTSTIATGQTIAGKQIMMPSSIYALTTGNYIAGTTVDMTVTLYLGGSNLSNLFIDPTPSDSSDLPALKFDLPTLFRHEIGHGLGVFGLTTASTGALGGQATLYDTLISSVLNAGTVQSASFTGANARAAFGKILGTNIDTDVPLTAQSGSQNLYHVTGTILASDLMHDNGIAAGTTEAISQLDIAILRDAGLTLTGDLVCYLAGTRIATPDGERPIETLRPGDLVRLADGATAPITWVGQRRVNPDAHPDPYPLRPILIRANAIAPGTPKRDLRVSPPHGVRIGAVLVPASLLVNHMTILRDQTHGPVTYHHVELDHHALLLAEGLAAESYLDTGNRDFFAGAGNATALEPTLPYTQALDRFAESACLPLLTDPETLRPIWRALADRARSLGYHEPIRQDETTDPRLLIGDTSLAPLAIDGTRLTFHLPAGTAPLRLVCATFRAADHTPYTGDTRPLGLPVRRIRFRDGTTVWDLPIDHPELDQGWHAPEAGSRWTDGLARIPRPTTAPVLLEIHLARAPQQAIRQAAA
jgi:hypothetical protein